MDPSFSILLDPSFSILNIRSLPSALRRANKGEQFGQEKRDGSARGVGAQPGPIAEDTRKYTSAFLGQPVLRT
eukprot:7082860-Pyramimonas_sp.AAC.1